MVGVPGVDGGLGRGLVGVQGWLGWWGSIGRWGPGSGWLGGGWDQGWLGKVEGPGGG